MQFSKNIIIILWLIGGNSQCLCYSSSFIHSLVELPGLRFGQEEDLLFSPSE